MSYCRWSSDDFRCDLYIYESAAGFVIHVAANRVEWDPPTSPYKLEKLQLPHEKWRVIYDVYQKALEAAPRHPIGLPYDGESFSHLDLTDLRDWVKELLAVGYRAPDWLLSNIEENLAQQGQ